MTVKCSSMKIAGILFIAINLIALISGSWEWFIMLGIGVAISPIIAFLVYFLVNKKYKIEGEEKK